MSGRLRIVLPVAVLVLLACTGLAMANGLLVDDEAQVGPLPDNSYLNPIGQRLSPTGEAILYERGRLQDSAVSPDGRFAVALAHRPWVAFVAVFDLREKTVVQTVPLAGKGYWDVSHRGVLWAPDGRTVWVAQSGNLLKFPVAPSGNLGTPEELWLPTSTTDWRVALPSCLVWAPDGESMLVTFNELNTLALVDPDTGETSIQIPVGNAPRDVVVIGNHAFVANQGGRPAQAGDFTNDSALTPIVADPRTGASTTGTVTEVDLGTKTVVRTYETGVQPSALLVRGLDILVANANDDTVTVIDTRRHRVGVTFNVNPAPRDAYGAAPNALESLPDGRLAVSLGRVNGVALFSYRDAYHTPQFLGLFPTGWYPSTLQWNAALDRLIVTNMKGIGSWGPESTVNQGPGTEPVTSHRTYDETGSISLVRPPRGDALRAATRTVFSNNRWNQVQSRRAKSDAKPRAIPRHVGEPSTIKHVFLIIKENRTYDQVLGDIANGNGDATLAQFGAETTPNHHALATEFPLLDNFYSGGTNSADGHIWLNQALVNDYMERQFGHWYRSYPYAGADSLAYAKSGFIWDNALRHGVSVRSWGEFANWFESDSGEQPEGKWSDWYRDSLILEGRIDGDLHVPVGYYKTRSDVPSMDSILSRRYPNFQLQIPDQYRATLFLQDLKQYEREGGLPRLNLIFLPVDHNSAGAPGYPTQSAQMADNDLAMGRVVEAISRSEFWKDSVVFVHEDDTQDGVDHVSGHRNLLLIASPYAKRGAVVSKYYTQLDLIKTIEQILGLPAMNQMDLAAVPIWDAFTDKPDFRPYTARPNLIPLDTMPLPLAQQSAVERAWSMWASKQDFNDLPERMDMGKLNHATWYATEGFDKPYPGESRVLWPSEVPDRPPVNVVQDD